MSPPWKALILTRLRQQIEAAERDGDGLEDLRVDVKRAKVQKGEKKREPSRSF
jgi:hypothetical protein